MTVLLWRNAAALVLPTLDPLAELVTKRAMEILELRQV